MLCVAQIVIDGTEVSEREQRTCIGVVGVHRLRLGLVQLREARITNPDRFWRLWRQQESVCRAATADDGATFATVVLKKISFRHLLIREIALPSSGCYWVANQCPQMARYIFSMVAYLQQWKFAQQHKIRHSNYKILPKTLLTPLRIAKDLILAAKVAKFHQIWSHCRHCSWTIPQRTVTVFQPL